MGSILDIAMSTPKTYLRGTKAEWMFILSISLILVMYEKTEMTKIIIDTIATYLVAGFGMIILAIPLLLLFVNPWKQDQHTAQTTPTDNSTAS